MSSCRTLEGLDGKMYELLHTSKMDWHVPGTCKKIVVLAVAKGESRLRPSPGPRQTWATTPARGSAFGLAPGEVLAARIVSARTPVPYPRMKTGSRCRTPDSWRAFFGPVRADRPA